MTGKYLHTDYFWKVDTCRQYQMNEYLSRTVSGTMANNNCYALGRILFRGKKPGKCDGIQGKIAENYIHRKQQYIFRFSAFKCERWEKKLHIQMSLQTRMECPNNSTSRCNEMNKKILLQIFINFEIEYKQRLELNINKRIRFKCFYFCCCFQPTDPFGK